MLVSMSRGVSDGGEAGAVVEVSSSVNAGQGGVGCHQSEAVATLSGGVRHGARPPLRTHCGAWNAV